ncbi:uncharacterized protein LOC131626995 isoform X2 [Vicia villosa]|uniref:uncharacterized protein LOC131626995 isoform X2 n=1 Tax=Vicia villosa TaxID=3911 RepID=UPI00273CA68A|nr:uncharacterized protein LOC131626995 isoform X2 [Vicia villosa]
MEATAAAAAARGVSLQLQTPPRKEWRVVSEHHHSARNPDGESTHMASQQITEEAVYLCTGNPLPKDIEQISYWLLNEQYSESFKRINDLKTRKGLTLVDIVREVTMFVFKIKIPPAVRVQLVNDLADIECFSVCAGALHIDVVVIESDDVVTAVAEEVTKDTLTKLVVGALSSGIFRSKHKGMSARISVCTPTFCTVYAVSKGKLSIRQSDTQIDGSTTDNMSEISFSSSDSSNFTLGS